jgi:hypothetical protein
MMQKSITFTTIFRVKQSHFRYDMQKGTHTVSFFLRLAIGFYMLIFQLPC